MVPNSSMLRELACSEGWADYILVAAGFNKNFVIYGEVELNNGTEETLLQEFEKIAKELDPWAASYVDCNSPDTYEAGVYLFKIETMSCKRLKLINVPLKGWCSLK